MPGGEARGRSAVTDMGLGKRYELKCLAAQKFSNRLNRLVRSPDGGWMISFRDDPELVILDSALNIRRRLDLQTQSQPYHCRSAAMSRDGRLIALSSQAELGVVDRSGMGIARLTHSAWQDFCGSSGVFDLENRLWYVRPGQHPG